MAEDLQQRISVQNLTIGCCNELQVTPRVLGGRRRTSRRLHLQQAIDNAKQPIPKAKLPTAMPIKVPVCVPLEIRVTVRCEGKTERTVVDVGARKLVLITVAIVETTEEYWLSS